MIIFRVCAYNIHSAVARLHLSIELIQIYIQECGAAITAGGMPQTYRTNSAKSAKKSGVDTVLCNPV